MSSNSASGSGLEACAIADGLMLRQQAVKGLSRALKGIFYQGLNALTKGRRNLRPPLAGARSCSIGCKRLVSMAQKSSSPFASATPEEDRRAAQRATLYNVDG